MGGFAGAPGDSGGMSGSDAIAPSSFDAQLDAVLDGNGGSDAGDGGAAQESAIGEPAVEAEVGAESEGVQDGAEPEEIAAVGEPEEGTAETQSAETGQVEAPPAEKPSGTPEGVRVRSVDGKPAWVVAPEVGQQAFAKAKLVDLAEKALGEPLTEAFIERQKHITEGFEGMRLDLLSDNPRDQANVVLHFADIIRGARERGEIGHDALSSFVSTAVDVVRQTDPQAFATVQRDLTRTVLDSIYEEALSTENAANSETAKAMWAAAQHIDKQFFGKFRPLDDLKNAQPKPRFAAAERPRPEAAPAPDTRQQAAEAYRTWFRAGDEQIRGKLTGHVDSVFTSKDAKGVSLESRYGEYPGTLKSLKDQLSSQVREALRGDQQLKERVRILTRRAELATSAEIRNQIQAQVVAEHDRRIQQLIAEKKGPILSEAAKLLASRSSEAQKRAQAAKAAGTQPSPSSGTAKRTVAPASGSSGKFFSSREEFDKAVDSILG